MANAVPIAVPGISTRQSELDPDTRTPPEKSSILPLSPPASSERQLGFNIDTALRVFDICRKGTTQRTSVKIKVPRKEFGRLVQALNNHPVLGPYYRYKLRFDYDPRCELLTIRMNTTVHECVSEAIGREMCRMLECFHKRDDSTGHFARQIVSARSSRIISASEEQTEKVEETEHLFRRAPDAQFQHKEAAFPGVVVEISYAQDGKNLDKLAWDYIQCSNGNIKAVIGLDINYRSSRPSTVSLWRSKIVREEGEDADILDVERVIENQPFQTATGEPLNEAQSIRLALSDFATDELCKGLAPECVTISFTRLAAMLDDAKSLQRRRGDGGRVKEGIMTRRLMKKRRRLSSSPDRLCSEDETLFLQQENRAIAVADQSDDDFQPPARKKASYKKTIKESS